MFRIPVSLLLGALLTLSVSCKGDRQNNTVKTQEISFTKDGELTLFKADATPVKELEIEIADDEYKIETGLMYRSAMAENRGMLFVFDHEEPRYFYMKNTNIPLDIIYLDAARKIVSIKTDAEPLNENSIPSEHPAQYVLEVNAGMAEKWGLQPGDSISYRRD
ncbi:DUF192 domain-containing protein [Sinomicrobium soli]|uniref:DUF192 domain-containing protein n=1 Tax=Sinomicrobium sp. N-1-3-6 TaxID=2219864 RepID=UPI000DCE12C1|nr:DUF192 domain-containing protein [Sinomicrobium sp. N-1-3-6]RAV29815.1 DUF192 domain-containing protein [Sinomicrobium sp. N-1-3-6]